MKLSAAMRKGAAIRPQGYQDYFIQDGGVLRSCALGAAWEGATGRRTGFSSMAVVWPELAFSDGALLTEIMKRNDRDRWTREQIADWLEAQGL